MFENRLPVDSFTGFLIWGALAGLWIVGNLFMRWASGWQSLSRFACDPAEFPSGEVRKVLMRRSSWVSCSRPCRVRLDTSSEILWIRPQFGFGFFHRPLRIPLVAFSPCWPIAGTPGFVVAESCGTSGVTFYFTEELTRQLLDWSEHR
ncbi:MAG: hypothetical protein QM680_12870 [Luteolibacter sp.]